MIRKKRFWMIGVPAALLLTALVGCTGKSGLAFDDCGPQGRGGRGLAAEIEGPRGVGSGEPQLSVTRSDELAGSGFAPVQGGSQRGRGQLEAAADLEDLPRGRSGRAPEVHGEEMVASGTLVDRDGEWALRTGEGLLQLGFGPETFREQIGIPLRDGSPAEIRGYLGDEGEIAVLTCRIGYRSYTFRTDDGVPLWSGRYRSASTAGASDAPRGAGNGGRGIRGGGRGRVGTS